MKAVNVLFTSVGRRVELLQAFRQAYQKLGIAGEIIAIDIDPLAPALQNADRAYIVPRLDSPRYLSTLLEICQCEQISLIFPLIDPDIPVLVKNRIALEQTGARVVVVSQKAEAITADKWLTSQFFQKCDVPSPRSWLPEHLKFSEVAYPVFIKPRNGSAAKNTFKVRDQEELHFFLKYIPNPIIQEFLPGDEITNDVICAFDGELLGIVSRQRIEVRWGEVAKGITIFDSTIIKYCERIAQALPARGPVTVQCIMKDGTPYFTEINARFGGGVPLGIAAGVDSPQWLLARAANIPINIPPVGQYKAGLYLTRYDTSLFLNQTNYEQMESRRL